MPNTKSRPKKRIAVIGAPVLQAQSRFNAALIQHATQTGRWKFVFSTEVNVPAMRFLRRLECDGALIRVTSPAVAREAQKLSFPVVNFSSWLANPQVPTVRSDNEMMGRLAAEHLLQKGFRRFGIVLSKGGWFIHPRHQSFLETVEAAGFGANVRAFHLHSHPASPEDLNRFREWVGQLKLPVGLFLTNDDPDAPALMEACRAAGFRIPYDVAFITSHGHPEICHACAPPLTYVDQNEQGLAFEAARYLDMLMAGGEHVPRIVVVPSGQVVSLASTDTVAVEDREVARAIEFIHAHISEPVNIKDVAQHMVVARRTLERRFRATMGVSLHEFQTRQRIDRARDLLRATPDMTMADLARRCGFANSARLKLVFQRVTGQSPLVFRKKVASRKTVTG